MLTNKIYLLLCNAAKQKDLLHFFYDIYCIFELSIIYFLIGPLPFSDILLKELVVEGFTFWRFIENRAEAEKALYKLICEVST